MKILPIFVLFILSLPVFCEKGDLTITINSIKNDEGLVRVILFTKEEGFPGEYKKGIKEISKKAIKDKLEFTFDSLEYGIYAVSVLHDFNSNGELDTTWYGKPDEGVGCSNNVRVKFRAPEFEEAKFSIDRPDIKQDIKVFYP